jgi:hypothetical protein
MTPCACGCGILVAGRFKRGHWWKTEEIGMKLRQRRGRRVMRQAHWVKKATELANREP